MNIEIRNLAKRFGNVSAVDNLSLRANAGEVVAILGPNGSGKSTLLKLLAGLLRPDQGELLFDGVTQEWSSIAVRRKTGYLPQSAMLRYPATGCELLKHFAALLVKNPKDALNELRNTFPANALERSITTYSTGMLQQLCFAIATLHDAPLLLLDEPTAALDPDAAATVRNKIVAERNHGKTVLLCTHDLLDVETTADRVILLTQGSIAGAVSMSELSDNNCATTENDLRIAAKLERIYRESIHN